MSNFTTRPEIIGNFGVVTSTHWIATAVGMSILEKGGNAFDAAVATGFTLQVVEPHLNGPGGEVPIIFSKNNQRPRVICGQGVAPRKATIDYYNKLGLNVVPGSGLLAAVVPGAFDAWMLLLLKHGSMKLNEILGPAISIAEKGYPLLPNIINTIKSVENLFLKDWKSSAEIYLPNGTLPNVGDFFSNKKMSETYKKILTDASSFSSSREKQIEKARQIWKSGFVAESIHNFCKDNFFIDTSDRKHKGLLDGNDLANWQAHEEHPKSFKYKNYEIFKTDVWGQGPCFLQQLAILDHFDLSDFDENSPEFVHIITEATKLAFADREAFYGDPNFINVPIDHLLSREYNLNRSKLITEKASLEVRPGIIKGFGGPVIIRKKGETEESNSKYNIGEPTVAKFDDLITNSDGQTSGDTTHFDIIDQWGNMVTATPSGGWLQSSPIIPELGFCLSNRAQMFWLDDKSPASLAPRKRPRTTLSPSFAFKDDKPYMVFGTPGGDQQDQWSLHFLLRHIHFGLNLQESIDAPGFSTFHFPNSFFPRETDIGSLFMENRFSQNTIKDLRRRGHNVTVEADWSLGRMTAASINNKILKAAANPRFMQGYAIGR